MTAQPLPTAAGGSRGRALVGWVVDAQVDFLDPAGRLYVRDLSNDADPGAAEVLPAMEAALDWMQQHCDVLVFTGDWHGLDDPEIDPVSPDAARNTYPPHCMGRSPDAAERAGAEIVDALKPSNPLVLTHDATTGDAHAVAGRAVAEGRPVFLRKTTFDVFEGNSGCESFIAALGEVLDRPLDFVVSGVARDVCVTQAVDGLQERGYPVTAIRDAMWGLGIEPEEETLARWRTKGRVITTDELSKLRPGVRRATAGLCLLAGLFSSIPVVAQEPPAAGEASFGGGTGAEATYFVYVGAESADLIHRVRLDPDGVWLDGTTPVGEMAIETEGPHGLNISPDGEFLYLTTAHGVPDGKLWKFDAGPDTLVAEPILLGNFPATLDLTPDGLFALVVNFNLHGEMVPSTVSVVYTPELVEVEQIATCVMPHGLRLEPGGVFAYTNCMMDDELVEIDTRTFEVSRRFSVAKGREGPKENYTVEIVTGPTGLTRSGSGAAAARMGHDPSCSPTWVEPAPEGSTIFVACNRGNEILAVDRLGWRLERRIPTGQGPYNLGVTPDGRVLVATLKGAGAVEFFNAGTGVRLAALPSSTDVTHGVAISPDSRFAFVSAEGRGAEPGRVDVYDLEEFSLVGSVSVGQQAGGIVFWKMEAIGS